MNLRLTAVTVTALAMFTVPTGLAAASPVPEPPPRPTTTEVQTQNTGELNTMLAELRAAYRTTAWTSKRPIHNEITLLLNVGRSALE